MNNENQAQANVTNLRQISVIWVVPVIALAIGIWMLYQYTSKIGPEITLQLSDASGIEVGKTEIRSLSVRVGVVTEVKLSENYDHILVKAQIDKDAERMLREDTLFWVVKPRIGREGISGLDTILSGSYIEIQPGRAQQEKLEFTVLDVPPVAPPDVKGLRVLLTHDRAGQLTVGDPVIYHGFTAGRVEKVSFDTKLEKALYQLFVYQPYDELIRSGTRFWINSGVDLQLNTEGVKLRFDSLESLLGGGVSFGIPDGEAPGEPVSQQLTQFALFNDQQEIQEGLYSQNVKYAMMFDESLRGLNPGAPVEFRGLRIGSVEKVPLFKPSLKDGFKATALAVLIRIDPKRIFTKSENISNEDLKKELQAEFHRGLRATLKTGNLLTGALYIDVDYEESEQAYTHKKLAGYDIFPSKPGGLAQVQKQVMDILDKFNNLPLNDTVVSMNRSLQALQRTLISAERTVNSIGKLVAQDGVQSLPAELQQSLDKIQQTLDGFTSNSTVYQNLDEALIQFEQTMAELEPVLQQINEKPNSLVFGEDQVADPIPVKGGK
jgi:paraquat-inducible protein B